MNDMTKTLIASLALFCSTVFAGTESGNGGGIVICPDGNGGETIAFFDLHLSRIQHPTWTYPGGADQDTIIQRALSKIERDVSPYAKAALEMSLNEVLRIKNTDPDIEIPYIPRPGPTYVRRDCQQKYLAMVDYRLPVSGMFGNPINESITVDGRLEEQLRILPLEYAAFLLHEAKLRIDTYYLKNPNAVGDTQRFTAKVLSDQPLEVDDFYPVEIQNFLPGVGFSRISNFLVAYIEGLYYLQNPGGIYSNSPSPGAENPTWAGLLKRFWDSTAVQRPSPGETLTFTEYDPRSKRFSQNGRLSIPNVTSVYDLRATPLARTTPQDTQCIRRLWNRFSYVTSTGRRTRITAPGRRARIMVYLTDQRLTYSYQHACAQGLPNRIPTWQSGTHNAWAEQLLCDRPSASGQTQLERCRVTSGRFGWNAVVDELRTALFFSSSEFASHWNHVDTGWDYSQPVAQSGQEIDCHRMSRHVGEGALLVCKVTSGLTPHLSQYPFPDRYVLMTDRRIRSQVPMELWEPWP